MQMKGLIFFSVKKKLTKSFCQTFLQTYKNLKMSNKKFVFFTFEKKRKKFFLFNF